MKIARRLALTVVIAALLSAVAYGSGWATLPTDDPSRTAEPTRTSGAVSDEPMDPARPRQGKPPADPAPDTPVDPVEPEKPELTPGPALLSPGDQGEDVKDLQARLKQIDWFEADVTGFYGDVTTEAVRGFQAKREIPVTGEVDRRTLNRLHGMTTEPTSAELTNQQSGNVPGALDQRCTTGRVLCVDKTSRTLRWVVDGAVEKTVDVRFGSEYTPTREGAFRVEYKSRDHVSSLYDTSMPFAMFFSGGQAVHYSPDFAAVGYSGASHGCVNVRDYDGIAWLFDEVQVGDKVIVYWS
jgi:peptidoglycan hydrolase-like protein with peptidoglycan-binding domain